MTVSNEILEVQYGLLDRQVGFCCRNAENVEMSWNEVRARGSRYSEGLQKAAWDFLEEAWKKYGQYCAVPEVSEGNEKCAIENGRKTVLYHSVTRNLAEQFSIVDRKAELAIGEPRYLAEKNEEHMPLFLCIVCSKKREQS